MHTLANQRLDGLQIELTRLAAVGEDLLGQAFYFARRFLLDGFERFFSCWDSGSASDGRKWQIWALTSRNSFCSVWNWRNSPISRFALLTAAASGRDSVRVLPWTL
jgi:hypothetical protein